MKISSEDIKALLLGIVIGVSIGCIWMNEMRLRALEAKHRSPLNTSAEEMPGINYGAKTTAEGYETQVSGLSSSAEGKQLLLTIY